MARKGEVIENPFTGERVVFLKTARDTDGELLQLDLFLRPYGFLAAEHMHPHQEEKFKVISGSLVYRVGGSKKPNQNLSQGEILVVPARTPHVWWNADEDEAHLVVEFRPALNIETFFETFFGLAREGKISKTGLMKGFPNPLQLAVIIREYKGEVRGTLLLHKTAFILAIIIAPIAKLLGYRGHYPQYSGPS